jgi:hypothetical protein
MRALALPLAISIAALAALAASSTLGACSSSSATNPAKPDGGGDGAVPFVPDECKASLAAGASANVTVGSGQSAYLDVADGTTLYWERGPQGGHHVWVALRMIGLRKVGTIVTIDVDDLDVPAGGAPDAGPTNINHSRVIFDFEREEGGHCVLYGLRMQLDNAGSIALDQLVGAHVRITATLQDPDGAKATNSREVVVTGLLD